MSLRFFALTAWLAMTSCVEASNTSLENRIAELQKEVVFIVTIAPYKQPCMGIVPMLCLSGIDENGHRRTFFEGIQGFEFVEGIEKTIKVRRTPRPEPVPADASMIVYKLVEEIQQRPATTSN